MVMEAPSTSTSTPTSPYYNNNYIVLHYIALY